jgi:hypothetical protein
MKKLRKIPKVTTVAGPAKRFVHCVLDADSSELGPRGRQGDLIDVDKMLCHAFGIHEDR